MNRIKKTPEDSEKYRILREVLSWGGNALGATGLVIICLVTCYICNEFIDNPSKHDDSWYECNTSREPIPDDEKVWTYDVTIKDSCKYTNIPSGEYIAVGTLYDVTDPKKKVAVSNSCERFFACGSAEFQMAFTTDIYEGEVLSAEYTLYENQYYNEHAEEIFEQNKLGEQA